MHGEVARFELRGHRVRASLVNRAPRVCAAAGRTGPPRSPGRTAPARRRPGRRRTPRPPRPGSPIRSSVESPSPPRTSRLRSRLPRPSAASTIAEPSTDRSAMTAAMRGAAWRSAAGRAASSSGRTAANASSDVFEVRRIAELVQLDPLPSAEGRLQRADRPRAGPVRRLRQRVRLLDGPRRSVVRPRRRRHDDPPIGRQQIRKARESIEHEWDRLLHPLERHALGDPVEQARVASAVLRRCVRREPPHVGVESEFPARVDLGAFGLPGRELRPWREHAQRFDLVAPVVPTRTGRRAVAENTSTRPPRTANSPRCSTTSART